MHIRPPCAAVFDFGVRGDCVEYFLIQAGDCWALLIGLFDRVPFILYTASILVFCHLKYSPVD